MSEKRKRPAARLATGAGGDCHRGSPAPRDYGSTWAKQPDAESGQSRVMTRVSDIPPSPDPAEPALAVGR